MKQDKEEKEQAPAEASEEELAEVVEPEALELKEEEVVPEVTKLTEALEEWKPKTLLGKRVRSGEITSIDEVLASPHKLLEPEIVDMLLPNLEVELLLIGQAKGKFGGGQRRIFKQTQKKTAEGNVPSFATMAAVGNKDGYVGLGMASSKETVPARNNAIRLAKLNIIKVLRGCGSWECGCGTPHSIPFKVTGKCGSVEITLIPAPKGTGLCVERECQKLLRLAGIRDVWSQTKGQTKTKTNLIKACFDALSKLLECKIPEKTRATLSIVEGATQRVEQNTSDVENDRKKASS
ncbi:30S ribosomal protein S5 [Candidatus Woesearchaeota archaeon]|nr:30S ribosomal protein S5 [Candidatus Woesearchaeota archaeon]